MRKLFVILITVFLLGLCVIPAFASTASPDEQVFSPLYIEGITNSATSESYPFPYNTITPDTQQTEFSIGNGLYGDYAYLSDGSVYGTFYMPEFQGYVHGFSVVMYAAAPQVINEIDLNSWEIGLPAENPNVDVTVQFNLLEPVVHGNEYRVNVKPIKITVDLERTRARIGNYMASQIPDTYDYVMISDLVITIRFRTNTLPINQLSVSYNERVVPASYNEYIRERHLTFEQYKEFPGMFDWLKDSVQSVLDLEIVPGLSLNGIFEVIVTVLVVFWLLKLLR